MVEIVSYHIKRSLILCRLQQVSSRLIFASCEEIRSGPQVPEMMRDDEDMTPRSIISLVPQHTNTHRDLINCHFTHFLASQCLQIIPQTFLSGINKIPRGSFIPLLIVSVVRAVACLVGRPENIPSWQDQIYR
ncbi:hypothetical protein J6590_001789 [Homalodisca vitripennis]|nr:hypothetical protein J6590_001789 [Homalodisca vitripennis]